MSSREVAHMQETIFRRGTDIKDAFIKKFVLVQSTENRELHCAFITPLHLHMLINLFPVYVWPLAITQETQINTTKASVSFAGFSCHKSWSQQTKYISAFMFHGKPVHSIGTFEISCTWTTASVTLLPYTLVFWITQQQQLIITQWPNWQEIKLKQYTCTKQSNKEEEKAKPIKMSYLAPFTKYSLLQAFSLLQHFFVQESMRPLCHEHSSLSTE